MSFNEIYEQYFADAQVSKDMIYDIWSDISKSLRIPEEKIRPTDRFQVELAKLGSLFYDWANDYEAFIYSEYRKAKATIPNKPTTIGEMILMIARLRERKNTTEKP